MTKNGQKLKTHVIFSLKEINEESKIVNPDDQ